MNKTFRTLQFLLVIFISSCHTSADKNVSTQTVTKQVKPPVRTEPSDSFIISERIDGPANIRDTVNGKVIFRLADNIPVSATEQNGNWLQVGINVDITKEQMDKLLIRPGSKIYINGKEAGQALEDLRISAFTRRDGPEGVLTGYTAINNIKPGTIIENAFSAIINTSDGELKRSDFTRFIADFELEDYDGLLPGLSGYMVHENWVDDPSPMLRIWLIFKGEKLLGVFHSRPMQLRNGKPTRVERGFYFTSLSESNQAQQLIDAFNSFIVQVD